VRLHFLGANRQVTGSRYLIETDSHRVMIDCGLFQERRFQDRNWQTSPIEPSRIDDLLLTHAHLDHVGLVPRLVARGYTGRIVTTKPSVDLARIVMEDAGYLQEEDIKYKKKRHRREGRKSPHPYEPLYTEDHAKRAGRKLEGVNYDEPVAVGDHITATFREAGHILGSACIEIRVTEQDSTKTVLFSGDIGQRDKPFIGDPSLFERADYVIMESTYGDREHCEDGPIDVQLMDVLNRTYERGGNLIVPTFAIERAQELIYHFGQLMDQGFVPHMPIYLDSPMAIEVTEVFHQYRDWMDADMKAMLENGTTPLEFDGLHMARRREDSKAINDVPGPKIVLAGSGMCTGGRIKHHLRRNITDPTATVLFVGYQAEGTLGRRIVNREKDVRIHGQMYDVQCQVAQVCGLSAHADRTDLLNWVEHFKQKPKQLFLTHGDAEAASSLAKAIRKRLDWDVSVPEYQTVVELQ